MNQYICFNFCIIIIVSFSNTVLLSLLLLVLYSEAVFQCCSASKVMLQVSQNSQENSKKEIPAQMFSCKFCEIPQNIFFKEPLDGCFGINTRPVYCPTMTFYLFKNNVTHIFWVRIFSV